MKSAMGLGAAGTMTDQHGIGAELDALRREEVLGRR